MLAAMLCSSRLSWVSTSLSATLSPYRVYIVGFIVVKTYNQLQALIHLLNVSVKLSYKSGFSRFDSRMFVVNFSYIPTSPASRGPPRHRFRRPMIGFV